MSKPVYVSWGDEMWSLRLSLQKGKVMVEIMEDGKIYQDTVMDAHQWALMKVVVNGIFAESRADSADA